MSVPNVPFYLSQAAAEFKVAVPTTASQILTAASLPTEGLLSRLAGMSAFVPTNTLTVGVSSTNNQWGWNPVSSLPFGAFSPVTTGSATWAFFYVNVGSMSLSSTVLITGTFEVTLATGASVTLRYNNTTFSSVIAGDVAAFISQVRAKVYSTLQVSIVRVA